MWFKNLTIYTFEKPSFQNTLAGLSLATTLGGKVFAPCTDTQRKSTGWVPPLGKESEALTMEVNGFILLTMATQERLLPASVVRERLAENVAEIEEREHRRVGSKEKKELIESIEDDLLPTAFTRTTKLDAWIDIKGQRLIINTTSMTVAEEFTTLLRRTIGSLPVIPATGLLNSLILTNWLSTYKLPEPFEFGDECELKGTSNDDQGTISFRKYELGDEIVKSCIESGKVVTKAALVWDKKISFTIGEDLVIRKLKFMDVLNEKMNEENPESHAERMAIEFTLMTGEVSLFLDALLPCFTSNEQKETA